MKVPKKSIEEKPLFWCPRCKEFKTCPRGSCEAVEVGVIQTKYIINNDNKVPE